MKLLTCACVILCLLKTCLGKTFFIESLEENLVFDVKRQQTTPGSRIHLWFKTGQLGQHWYLDDRWKILRSALSDHCIDIDENYNLMTNVCNGAATQHWTYDESKTQIVNDYISRTVGLHYGTFPDGPYPYAAYHADHCNKHFIFVHTDNFTGPITVDTDTSSTHRPVAPFYIQSKYSAFTTPRVLDIEQANNDSGARVLVFGKQYGRMAINQLWYEDDDGYVRSFHYKFVLDSTGGIVRTARKEEQTFPNPQSWIIVNNVIVNKDQPNLVLTVQDNGPSDHASLRVEEFYNKDYQLWDFITFTE